MKHRTSGKFPRLIRQNGNMKLPCYGEGIQRASELGRNCILCLHQSDCIDEYLKHHEQKQLSMGTPT